MNPPRTIRTVLPGLAAGCGRHPFVVIGLALLLAAGALTATQRDLGVTTDTSRMFAASLPWKQRTDAIAQAFPQNDDLLVAVVDAATPEQAAVTADALAARLRADTRHFAYVAQPDRSEFLERNALLFLDRKPLADLLDRTIDAQPFLGQLVADPSLRGVFQALGLIAQGVARGQADLGSMQPALRGFHATLQAALAGRPAPLSWERLMAGPLADQAGRYSFVLAKPHLDFGALQSGGAASDALRADAAALAEVRAGAARVRLTGQVALDDEEFATVARGAAVGLIGSFVLVIVWLFLAVRSWRLVLPILATLVLGLLLTTGFAALTVGTLNLISVAFAILFVGIAVDFAIQFTVRLRERRHTYPDMSGALRETARRSGAQILIAALATAAGFLAFTPTQFIGVAQLGIIAGGGMIIAFAGTLTFLPAMLALCRPGREPAEIGFAWARPLDKRVASARRPILAGAAMLAVAGAALTPFLPFDGDPLHTKNQHTEAVETLRDLAADPVTNPYTVEALLPSLAAARDAAARLGHLGQVGQVLTLASFVPEDQPAKLALITDAAGVLGATLAAPDHVPRVDAAALRDAAVQLSAGLMPALPKLGPSDALRAVATDVATLARAQDGTLLEANAAMTRFLPLQLGRLRTALAAHAVTATDIPPGLRRDWVLPDGRARIQIFPGATVHGTRALRHFVDAVRRELPQAAGSAVWIVRSTQTILRAFRIAALSALVAIALILAIALRRALDVAMVMAPLVLSALTTVVVLTLLGQSLNFANIIALPLLLGVGVSFNIYFVMNWRAGHTRFLGSATARAVMFSALTTGTAFGSLALSAHPGTASMGRLLLISLACTVAATLVFVPAMLSAAGSARTR